VTSSGVSVHVLWCMCRLDIRVEFVDPRSLVTLHTFFQRRNIVSARTKEAPLSQLCFNRFVFELEVLWGMAKCDAPMVPVVAPLLPD
jgi:hypothetical protein